MIPRSVSRLGAIVLLMWLVMHAASANDWTEIVLLPPVGGAPFDAKLCGMHVHELPSDYGDAPSCGAIRLWDAKVGWAYIQPTPTQWEWRRLDMYVDWAATHGLEILLPLGLTPQWASARPSESSPYGPGRASEPRDLDSWRAYVHAVAERYRGRIRGYEVWNEANLSMFYTGSLENLAALTVVAGAEVKKVDPSAIVVAPSAVGLDGRVTWPAKLVSLLPRGSVDVVSFHLYTSGRAPEVMVEAVPALRKELEKVGAGSLPLWNTETGYWVPNPAVQWSPSEERYRISESLAAQYVPRAMLLAQALGFGRFYWYAWDNKKMGFVSPDGGGLRPAGRVLRQFVRLMQGVKLERCVRDRSAVWRCELTFSDGRRAMAYWSDPSAPGPKAIDSPFESAMMHRLDGMDRGGIAPKRVPIDGTVVLLVEGGRNE